MSQTDKYYHLLGLEPGARIDDIKKAYRTCARKYHPDLNKSASASHLFIETTEAYQFLLAHHKSQERLKDSDFINEWENYKKEQARRTAYAHAGKRYNNFVKSDLYKSTRILDKTRYYIGIAFAVFIIIMAVYGYIYRLRMVDLGFEKPTLAGFLFLMFIGLLFLVTSLLFLYNYHWKNKK
ncbi:MAG: DnaJ domain-containing protein [Bacteroidales bacterium]|nr:DnaJ domain-containing protein [Bacteroidales bacterium]